MKKQLLLIIILIIYFKINSQVTYPSLNISLLSKIDPEKTYALTGSVSGDKYSGCWG